MRVCKECGKPIIFIKTVAGKGMPCDQEQLMYWRGNSDTIVTPNGEVHKCSLNGNIQDAVGIGYRPHWATCTNADRFRKRGRER